MVSDIPGTRIRQYRRDMGVTQAALARKVGISPSYLNLIEWNKRPIAGTLLRKIAEALDLTLDDLGSVAEERLRAELVEIAHLPALESADVEADRSSELIGRFPGWARGVAALARSEREATTRAQVSYAMPGTVACSHSAQRSSDARVAESNAEKRRSLRAFGSRT